MSVDEALAVRLHRSAKAERWDVPLADFAATLESSGAKSADGTRDPADVERYLNTIRHASVSVTEAHYVHLLKDDLVAASQQVEIAVAPRRGGNVVTMRPRRKQGPT